MAPTLSHVWLHLPMVIIASCRGTMAFMATSAICDRSASRDARFVLERVIAPQVAAAQYQLPPDCPLDASLDMFSVQESHKHLVRKGVWRCDFDAKDAHTVASRCLHHRCVARTMTIPCHARAAVLPTLRCPCLRRCTRATYVDAAPSDVFVIERQSEAQVFRGEVFIDKHMDHKHSNETDPSATACLADMCGPLHCDFFQAYKTQSISSLRHVPCHLRTMEENKMKCQDLAHKCFPPHLGRAAETLHAFMLDNFCAAATCRWRQREELLRPLASDRDSSKFLWALLVWSSLAVLVIVYVVLFCRWNARTASVRASILSSLGLKKKTKKLF